jgi:hypothetical protein
VSVERRTHIMCLTGKKRLNIYKQKKLDMIITSPMIGLPEKALIPSWNLGAISLTFLVIFLSLITIMKMINQMHTSSINEVLRIFR